jgi:hypothetical protein
VVLSLMDLKVGEWYYGSEKGRVLFKLSRQNEFTFLINSAACSQCLHICRASFVCSILFCIRSFFSFSFRAFSPASLFICSSRQAVSLSSCPAASCGASSRGSSRFLYPHFTPARPRPTCCHRRTCAKGRRQCRSPRSFPSP